MVPSLTTSRGRGKADLSLLLLVSKKPTGCVLIQHIRGKGLRYAEFIKGEPNEKGLEQYLAQAIK